MTEYKKINELVDEELEEAVKNKGLFVDGHQAFGVIVEEWIEFMQEVDAAKECVLDFMKAMMNDDEDGMYEAADKGHNYMTDALREGIQVDAMFKKVTIKPIE